jgi:pyruvate/2-oxoglutarate dehydrogenase complex dihydrolipoamide dehydrogenase (E3) component
VNPAPRGRYHLVVIGGGTAGLVSAVGAASRGAQVALIEKHLLGGDCLNYGGDCLNYGCVPSKGLIRAGRAVEAVREAGEFGVRAGAAAVDFKAAMERMRGVQARIAHNDSAERLRALGVDVYLGRAKFVSRNAVEVDGRRLESTAPQRQRPVFGTGSSSMRGS